MTKKSRSSATKKLQTLLEESLDDLPRLMAIELILGKLDGLDLVDPRTVAEAVADLVLKGEDDLEWDESWGPEPAGLEDRLTFTSEDLTELDRIHAEFRETELSGIVRGVAEDASRSMLLSMKRRWRSEHARQVERTTGFRMRLEQRWGKALDAYRRLHTAALDVGGAAHGRRRRSRSIKNLHRADVLIRLHARACQVASEILVLMEAGFADGAMARWRTLHEIAVVMNLVHEHDDDLAKRYLVHEVVEAKRALDLYRAAHVDLGYAPPDEVEAARTEEAYGLAIAEFGKAFGTSYGWAAHHLKTPQPTFADLEKAAGRFRMRSYYKMASQPVHAGVKGITNLLGAMGDRSLILSAPSNAGLHQPGQNAVITLAQVTILLIDMTTADGLAEGLTFQKMQSEGVDAFVAVHRKLRRETARKS